MTLLEKLIDAGPAWLTAFAAVGAFILSWLNMRKITHVEHATNSIKDELVEVTRKESFAAGVKQEKERIK